MANQDIGAAIVGRRLKAGELHRAGDPEPGFHRRHRNAAPGDQQSLAQLDPGIGQDCVVAPFGVERDVVVEGLSTSAAGA